MQTPFYDILPPHEPGLEYGENAAEIAADVMAAHIAAAPAFRSHVGETRGGGEAVLQAPHASVSAEAPPRDRSVSRVMAPEKLSNDECRFINLKRLITEYIPPVLRQLFVLRWNERHPDDKWDDRRTTAMVHARPAA